jgi:outer membrane receptor protein involved in Fe transport
MRVFQRNLLGGAAALALIAASGAAWAEDVNFNIAPQPLASALNQFGAQSDTAVLVRPDLANAKMTRGVSGAASAEVALNTLLEGTGLTYRREGDTFLIVSASDPQSGSAAGDGADEGTVAALIVTAQKREENIQDVPIAISAFTEKSLQEQKIEGGFDLLKAIPNVTFSKNNFTSYNFSIRGIGTKAVSATTDPGVAVSFNNIALLQNRLFEQEYFDVERVEVLRGPQGTLYGRNATAGVINVISAKPNLHDFDGWLKGEVGNYHTKRVSAMINMPLVEDKLAVRIAGALTDRQGYDYNSVTQHAVNGRDLWSARVTVAFNPTENIRSNLVWERFNEDDNRSRTGKQLCHRDPGPTSIDGVPVYSPLGNNALEDQNNLLMRRALFSQGCKPGSLYDESAFGTPNGLALPFVFTAAALYNSCGGSCVPLFPLSEDSIPFDQFRGLIGIADPYASVTQSRDLRTIASFRDPRYRAQADVVELNIDVDLTPDITLSSQTAYNKDTVYSFQDFNRFNTKPIFYNTDDPDHFVPRINWDGSVIFDNRQIAPGGVFCDPQLGCSNTMAGFDISQATGTQFTEELRIASSFDGPLNFSAGANYTKFDALVDYYVFFNLITAQALIRPFNMQHGAVDLTTCNLGTSFMNQFNAFANDPVPATTPNAVCPYVDPNPIESINGQGHNYFRSKNPYKLKSWAGFGELYWQASDSIKITAGLRYTDDRKTFIPVPSQVLLAPGVIGGGTVSTGYPELPAIKQHWGEWTGRLGVDWKPQLTFTDQTMLYAFYSRGYKGGGANPPQPGFASYDESVAQAKAYGYSDATIAFLANRGWFPILRLTAAEYGRTFKPEFVNAFEVGSKNTLLGGALTANTDAFYYDYKDYQVSQIRDRTAVNENFDAHIWGLEFETAFAPTRDLRFVANLGYLDTKIGKGMKSIDIMNRTQGNPDYTLVKPWLALPSNCVVPTWLAKQWLTIQPYGIVDYWSMCGGAGGLLRQIAIFDPSVQDPATGKPYDPLATDADGNLLYPELNGGAGLYADLSGNKLPNSPHWTMNIGAQYGHDILDGSWRATVRADAYWQSQSWARVYNDNPYDKLHGWYNVNLSVWFEKPDDDLKIELYAKNILDKTPITDTFLNSDDTALTTNVFVLDPRLIGLSIHKGF